MTWHDCIQVELGQFEPATLAALAGLPTDAVARLDYTARRIAVEYARQYAGTARHGVDAVIALLRRAEEGEVVPAAEGAAVRGAADAAVRAAARVAAGAVAGDAAWAAAYAAAKSGIYAAWAAAGDAAGDAARAAAWAAAVDAARAEIKARIEAAIIAKAEGTL
jgi:hypothetical protein